MNDLIQKIDRKYLTRCLEIASKGTCLRRKVGAVLIRNPFKYYAVLDYEKDSNLVWIKDRVADNLELDHYHVCSGYNTTVTGKNTCEQLGECLMHNGHCIRTIHAEIRCILNSNQYQRDGGWIYISTAPCIKCFQEIACSGIKRVVMEETSSWETHKEFEKPIREIANEVGIELWRRNERL